MRQIQNHDKEVRRLLQRMGAVTFAIEMPDIVLATLNAKYIHASFGLRYLLANMGDLRSRTELLEFDIKQRPLDVAEMILARKPRIIGLGVYIWNTAQTAELLAILRRLAPDAIMIAGGPEVSFETTEQTLFSLVDYVITGEADLKFAELSSTILSGQRPRGKVIAAELPDFSRIRLPYDTYTDQDIAHRIVYLEASRGCPFSCEFCLSSLDVPVRQVPLEQFLREMETLLRRGVKQFKFVDRTFNLNLATSSRILEFCLENYRTGLFFHFELVPDRLPESLRTIIARFPPGALQFEVGIQTFNPQVASRISRRQNYERLEQNLRYLRGSTGVHLHADLIAGLPGEDMESFAAGFDRLVGLGPHEIQVGILKRLRGTPIIRHDAEWQMVYNPNPPYELLQNRQIDHEGMQRLRRFARYWDLIGNSGNFIETTPLFWRAATGAERSPFDSVMRFSVWLHEHVGRGDGIALVRLMEFVFRYLTAEQGLGTELVAHRLWRDYQRGGRKDKPGFMKDLLIGVRSTTSLLGLPKRQARHAVHLG